MLKFNEQSFKNDPDKYHIELTKIAKNKYNHVLKRWKKHKIVKDEEDAYDWKFLCMNTAYVNKLFKNDCTSEYIYFLGDSFSDVKNKKKYICSLIDIINNHNDKMFEPPRIEIWKNHISFFNGRTRFSNMRDLGVKQMWMIVSYSSEFDT